MGKLKLKSHPPSRNDIYCIGLRILLGDEHLDTHTWYSGILTDGIGENAIVLSNHSASCQINERAWFRSYVLSYGRARLQRDDMSGLRSYATHI